MSEAKWQEVYKVQTAAIAELEQRIAELEAVLQELTDLMENTITGEYNPDSFTTQPARAALAIRKEIDNG